MRKIIHIDMDCFYAAIEERDNPDLRGHPIGVGGRSRRGVLTTANYEARKFGCRSAMPVFKALEKCPQLIIVPVRFDVYRAESKRIHSIFQRFTETIEPLSLDEAYLDVSHRQTSAAVIAREIRTQIREKSGLTASAGIAPNKLLAKIASDWKKPDGQYELKWEEILSFLQDLPVDKLSGIGPKTESRLEELGIHTCGQLQTMEKLEMARRFGSWGVELYDLARGIDDRPVRTERIRKSLSCENTFSENIAQVLDLLPHMDEQLEEIWQDLTTKHADRAIRSLVVKLKFSDFTRTTAERAHPSMDRGIYEHLLREAWNRGQGKSVRLLGVGVRFRDPEEKEQLDLF